LTPARVDIFVVDHKEADMTMNNEQIVRDAYQVAEIKDIPGWIACFTEDGNVTGDTVVVQLALQGTHKGPLALPFGNIPPTGKRMDAPCCDVFRLKDGKIQSFDCYPSGTVILNQLGVLQDLGAVLTR
jgi:ketosteroid isomerase-like protein